MVIGTQKQSQGIELGCGCKYEVSEQTSSSCMQSKMVWQSGYFLSFGRILFWYPYSPWEKFTVDSMKTWFECIKYYILYGPNCGNCFMLPYPFLHLCLLLFICFIYSVPQNCSSDSDIIYLLKLAAKSEPFLFRSTQDDAAEYYQLVFTKSFACSQWKMFALLCRRGGQLCSDYSMSVFPYCQ